MMHKMLLASAVCAVSIIQGCVHMAAHDAHADCRSCHVDRLAPGARDFSAIYAKPSSHHPVGVDYPDNPEFNQPDSRRGNTSFFDSNGNELPDSDEIQLFGKADMVKAECASCHREHGSIPAPAGVPANYYLRVDNINSALCLTCHKK